MSKGKGMGGELYNYIENDFRINKIKQISLLAILDAVQFYEKLHEELKNG